MRPIPYCVLVVAALAGCTTTAVLQESTPVAVSANRPPPPPPPEPEPEPEPPRVEVEETRIRVDETIHFELDSAEISPVSDGLLREIAQVMNDNPQITRIRVEGHTDRQGSARYNQGLSQRRAESVVEHLVQHGVARERLEPEGFGFSRPVADGETAEAHARNRRVEFNIVEQQDAAQQGEEEQDAEPAEQAAAEGGEE